MSTLTHALGPTYPSGSAPSDRFPVEQDVDMKPPQSALIPKDEDNDPSDDAGMDDLFGNDDDEEAKDDEEDSKPERFARTHIVCILRLTRKPFPIRSSRITGTSTSSRARVRGQASTLGVRRT